MYIDEIYAARDYIQSRYKNPIDVAIVLGSGLGPLADVINEPVEGYPLFPCFYCTRTCW